MKRILLIVILLISSSMQAMNYFRSMESFKSAARIVAVNHGQRAAKAAYVSYSLFGTAVSVFAITGFLEDRKTREEENIHLKALLSEKDDEIAALTTRVDLIDASMKLLRNSVDDSKK